MFRKTLLATAIAGVFGCSAGAFADTGADHSAYGGSIGSYSAAGLAALEHDRSARIEIGDGLMAAIGDEEFDGYALEDGAMAVGASAGSGAGGEIAFSSDSGVSTHRTAARDETPLADEAYLVPAPLSANDGRRYWKVEVTASDPHALERLATENVYVMMPIEDAVVDPVQAITRGPDVVVDSGSGGSDELAG